MYFVKHVNEYLRTCFSAYRARHEIIGKIHVKQIYEIAKIKKRDSHMDHISLEAMCKCIAGSCGSMGIEVVRD